MSEIDEVKRRRKAAVTAALTTIGEDLLGRAQREAPVEEGTLRGSGTSHVHEDGDTISVEVSFATPYAARQHEEVSWKHPKGGKAKYLEDPLKAMSARYLAALAAAVKKVS